MCGVITSSIFRICQSTFSWRNTCDAREQAGACVALNRRKCPHDSKAAAKKTVERLSTLTVLNLIQQQYSLYFRQWVWKVSMFLSKKIQSQNIQSVPNVYTHIFIAIEVQLQHRQQPRAFSITSAFSVMWTYGRDSKRTSPNTTHNIINVQKKKKMRKKNCYIEGERGREVAAFTYEQHQRLPWPTMAPFSPNPDSGGRFPTLFLDQPQ